MKLYKINKEVKKIVSLMMVTSMIMININPIYANDNLNKEEVIYINLEDNGDVSDIHVVNSFNPSKDGAIKDYGNYESVLNLSTDDKLNYSNGVVKTNINTSEDTFYYQGNIEKSEVPWDINIGYKLDGKNIKAKDLAGKSGNLEITLGIKENEKANPIFFDNYTLQIGLIFDTTKCSNIVAEGGSMASVGAKKSITYMHLPETEKTYTINANVKDFEMEAITLNALNMNMDIDVDTSDLVDSVDELAKGVTELNNGAGQLKEGISGYKDGVDTLNSGIVTLDSEINKYKEAIDTLNESDNKLLDGASSLNNRISQIKDGSSSLDTGSKDLSEGLNTLSNGSDTYKQNLDTYLASMTQVLEILKATLPLEMQETLQIETLLSSTNAIGSGYTEIDNGIKQSAEGASTISSGTSELTKNIGQLSQGSSDLYNGVSELTSSNEMLASAAGQIQNGTNELKDGSNELAYGINELNTGANELNSGTNELNNSVVNMPNMVNNEIDSMMSKFSGSDFKPVSYISDKNVNVESVQFAIKTQAIEKEEIVEAQKEKKEEGLWQRFLNIFN